MDGRCVQAYPRIITSLCCPVFHCKNNFYIRAAIAACEIV
ncbi:hypothetical protein BN129_3362 [Cronobacter sakazakii 701]|nr:hypothetical protein BN129_3362 [Cronobacter sakazakii 701]